MCACKGGQCRLKGKPADYVQPNGTTVPATVLGCLASGKMLIEVNGVRKQVWRQRLRKLP